MVRQARREPERGKRSGVYGMTPRLKADAREGGASLARFNIDGSGSPLDDHVRALDHTFSRSALQW
jgi:hypothetical protein